MRSDKFKAYKLRSQGRSYNEISRLLRIPKSTLSNWFKGLQLPDEATARIKKRVYEGSRQALIRRNIDQTHLAEKRAREIRDVAKKEIGAITSRDLLLLGVALYWTEGYKRPIVRDGKIKTYHPVSLTNSDPKLISMFLRFLREICKVPDQKIKINIRFFEHQNENYLLSFWQDLTRLSPSQFVKSYTNPNTSSQRKRPHNILPYGVVQIRVSDTALYHRIMGLIDNLGTSI